MNNLQKKVNNTIKRGDIMWKKILISTGILILLSVGITLIYVNKEKNEDNKSLENKEEIIENEQISEELVDDDCISEWEDYEEYQKELEEASSMYQNNDIHYIVKSVDNYINVYYIDDYGNNILYKETNIYIKYLEEEDIHDLENGIDVYGAENLNKLLEDFE